MTGTATDYFLQTLDTLRNAEEILLYANAVQIPSQELELAAAFLETEYDNECLGYPGQAPAFDAAALWAAKKKVYIFIEEQQDLTIRTLYLNA
jgi:MoxR-vWA-beta-propeller ternary system domain bpX4